MAAEAIGSLFVSLGLDTAVFSAGIKQVQSATGKLQKNLEAFGKRATNLGKNLSVISAGMAAAGAAAFAMVQGTAAAGQQIDTQAKIANASARDFQMMAAGAKTVGIEQEKLADILKDVNDRVGDFIQTGGGPMADFFENIAPKVGVTAEQFQKLSGPDALQLYVSSLEKAGLSQQEMTFYLEAMASDATALIPLLANGGKEMARLGAAADAAGGIMSDKAIAASKGFNEQLRRLQDGAAGLRNKLSEALLPVFTDLIALVNDRVIPGLHSMIGIVQQVIEWFTALPGPIQEAAGVIAAALGVGGPVLLAIGALSTGISLLIGATGPIGLFIAAAALLSAAWVAWGDEVTALFDRVSLAITEKFTAIRDFLTENGRTILLAMTGPIGLSILAWEKWGEDIKTSIGGALDWVVAKFNEFLAFVEGIPARMAEIGRQIVQGLIDGLQSKWNDLKQMVVDMANSLPDWVKRAVGIQSPSRVFKEIGMYIMQGLGLGISENIGQVQTAMDGVNAAINGTGASMSTGLQGFGKTASDVFRAVALEGKSLSGTLKEMASGWLSNTAGKLFDSAIGSIFGIGANANGTNDWRGGLTRVNERGGEIMNLPSGTQIIPHDVSKRMATNSGGGMVDVRVSVDNNGNLQAYINKTAGDQVRAGVGAYDTHVAPTRIKRVSASPRRVGN